VTDRHRTLAVGTGLLALLAGWAGPAESQDKNRFAGREREAQVRAETRGEAVRQLGLAHELEEYGRETRSPMALIAAARVLRRVSLYPSDLPAEPRVEGVDGRPATGVRVEPPLSTGEAVAVLLADARHLIGRQVRDGSLARGEAEALGQLARQVETMKMDRGAIGGPKQRAGYLHPGEAHCYRICVVGWGPARVRVLGPARAALELTVSSDHGRLRGATAGPNPGVEWWPHLPGLEVVTVRLANPGPAGAAYRLLVN
jgi:hypothetical protein